MAHPRDPLWEATAFSVATAIGATGMTQRQCRRVASTHSPIHLHQEPQHLMAAQWHRNRTVHFYHSTPCEACLHHCLVWVVIRPTAARAGVRLQLAGPFIAALSAAHALCHMASSRRCSSSSASTPRRSRQCHPCHHGHLHHRTEMHPCSKDSSCSKLLDPRSHLSRHHRAGCRLWEATPMQSQRCKWEDRHQLTLPTVVRQLAARKCRARRSLRASHPLTSRLLACRCSKLQTRSACEGNRYLVDFLISCTSYLVGGSHTIWKFLRAVLCLPRLASSLLALILSITVCTWPP